MISDQSLARKIKNRKDRHFFSSLLMYTYVDRNWPISGEKKAISWTGL